MASTSLGLFGPPVVTVSNFAGQTALCWEDNGISTNPYGGCSREPGPIVKCVNIGSAGAKPVPSYDDCGIVPQFVYNPSDGVTQLMLFLGGLIFQYEDYPSEEESIGDYGSFPLLSAPLEPTLDGVFCAVDPLAPLPNFDAGTGLIVTLESYRPGGYYFIPTPIREVDAAFDPSGQFEVAGNPTAQVNGILELDGKGLRALAWDLDAGVFATTPIPSPQTPTGPMVAATCQSGFGYFTMTEDGAILFAEQAFDGSLMPGAGLLALGSFTTTPTATTLAAAPSLDGGLFLAVSSPAQIGVYLVPCQ